MGFRPCHGWARLKDLTSFVLLIFTCWIKKVKYFKALYSDSRQGTNSSSNFGKTLEKFITTIVYHKVKGTRLKSAYLFNIDHFSENTVNVLIYSTIFILISTIFIIPFSLNEFKSYLDGTKENLIINVVDTKQD